VALSTGLGSALAVVLSSRSRPEPPVLAPSPAPAPVLSAAPRPEAPPPRVPERPAPTPQPAKAAPPALAAPAGSFDRWVQDFDRAQKQAREQGKDVLLLFDASDWSDPCRNLAREVFARPELWKPLTDRFVLVHLDFPRYPRATRRVQDSRRNQQLQARFFKQPAYPQVVLTDATGRPYALEVGYKLGQTEQWVKKLQANQDKREDRDELLASVAKATGPAKLPAAEAALKFLAQEMEHPSSRGNGIYVLSLAEFYGPLLREWRALADVHDPQNAAGYRERFFRADWGRRWQRAMSESGTETRALRALAEEFDRWSGGSRFKDPDLGADLLTCQARLRSRLGDRVGTERAIRTALDLHPSPVWQKLLTQLLAQAQQPKMQTGLGTGFVVAPEYVLTSYHVVRGTGPVRVRIPDRGTAAGTVVAQDESCDLALLKVEGPAGMNLPPLAVAPQAPAGRGTEVMALGYALGGGTLKFTRGAVSARLNASGRAPLLLLDQRLNPGNSGGPLCDACGNLVGVVAAKTAASAKVDSYGIAVGVEVVDSFLRQNLEETDYRPSRAQWKKLDWTEVDRKVSPSVVLVLKERGLPGADARAGADAQNAAAMARLRLETLRRVAGLPEQAQKDIAAAIMLMAKADEFNQRGQYVQAEPLLRQVLAIFRRVQGPEHPDTANSLNNLAVNLAFQGKHSQAEVLLRQALAISRKAQGEQHPDTAKILNNLASALEKQGKRAEAETLYRQAHAIPEKGQGDEHPSAGWKWTPGDRRSGRGE
jgi:S1-C subfamily serine protease/thioredoxin-related protein